MKRIMIPMILALTFALGTASMAFAEPQTVCPVMGNAINKDLYADYKGKRVYFCCPPCKKRFEKDPAKYVKEMEEKGIELEEVKK